MNKKFGLTTQQAEESRKLHGTNALSIKEAQTIFEMYLDSFKDPWIIILTIAFIVKLVLNIFSTISNVGEVNWYETVGLVFAILLSTGVSTYSNYKNQQDFNTLQAENSKIISKVYRDNKLKELMIDEIVKGDAILLQAGDKVPADGIILNGSVKVDQAVLNGESEEAKKVELGNNTIPDNSDTYNQYKIFRGTTIMSGEVVMEATELGDNTLLGTINTSLQENGKKSPSAEKLNVLGKSIGVMGYTASAIYILIALFQTFFIDKVAFDLNTFSLITEIIMYSVTIIIMAVPEGLPMMNALVSSMNGRRLSKENILVVNSESIETAGYLNKLFTDKTGTVTEGILSLVGVFLADGTLFSTDDVNKSNDYSNLKDNIKDDVVNAIGLNNDANVVEDEKGNKYASGSNNTDRALLNFLISRNQYNLDNDVILEKESFDSAKKSSNVTLKNGVKYIKGAPELILSDVKYYINKYGEQKEFTSEILDKFNQTSIEQANRSMRVIAIIKEVDNNKILIGGVCIRDNIRQGISKTVETLNKAGIDVVMVTGDRKETAVAIAKESKILSSETDIVLTHEELSSMTDEELKKTIPNLKVVARALPDDKKRLVKLSQDLDLVVGMTGDGVNDSPALKAADVGFSMGDGTSVAQEASDIVIVNNSLSSIEKAVLYGRTMTKSVQKFIIFQLTVNVATIAMSLLSPLIGVKEPFSIIQILWINLIMDTLAALAFGMEPALNRFMNEKPIERKAKILTKYMKSSIGVAGLFITLGCIAIMTNFMNIQDFIGDSSQVSTFMFTFFIYSIIFNSLNTRSEGFNLFEHIGENKNFSIVMISIAIVQTLIIQFGGLVFGTVPMDIKHYGFALLLSALVIPVDFIKKAFIKLMK